MLKLDYIFHVLQKVCFVRLRVAAQILQQTTVTSLFPRKHAPSDQPVRFAAGWRFDKMVMFFRRHFQISVHAVWPQNPIGGIVLDTAYPELPVSVARSHAGARLDALVIRSADPHLSEYLPAHWQARRELSGFCWLGRHIRRYRRWSGRMGGQPLSENRAAKPLARQRHRTAKARRQVRHL